MLPGALLLGLLASTGPEAAAARPAPDYRAELHGRMAAELEALNAIGRFDEVIERGGRFDDRVERSAVVAYEIAYAHNRKGDLGSATRWYDRALEADPRSAAARYDRGELRLQEGDVDGAHEDFSVAAEERPDHWVVHFRLAQVAGRRGDDRAFRTHLTDALRHGFDFRTILADPEWRAYAQDEALGAVLRRLIRAYSDEQLWVELSTDVP